MLAKVQKWGNSLALRIPKSYALEAKLEKDSDVEISLEGQLVIRPMGTIKQDLVHLLSGITEDNLHDAQFNRTGSAA